MEELFKKGVRVLSAVTLALALSACSVPVEEDAAPVNDGAVTSSVEEGSDDEISQGLGSQDASADVKLGKVVIDPDLGWTTAKVTVTNNSDGKSDYWIELVAESEDGSEQYDTAFVMVSGLKPGQKKSEEATFFEDIPEGAIVKFTEIQRTAS